MVNERENDWWKIAEKLSEVSDFNIVRLRKVKNELKIGGAKSEKLYKIRVDEVRDTSC
jgi:hypothetical protein